MMNVLDLYKKNSVEINCNGIMGSGCIFQPNSKDYTYIFTAKHCLKGKDNSLSYEISDINISNELRNDVSFEVIDTFEHDTLDVVLILVKYINLSFKTFTTKNIYEKKIGIFGYPEIFKRHNLNLRSQKLDCVLTNENGPYLEVQTPHTSSYMNAATTNIVGFSGSGIYVEYNNQIFLIGILTELKDKYGTFNILVGVHISELRNLISVNGLPDVIPYELSSFEGYLSSAFEVLDGSVKDVLLREANKLVNGSPQYIIENLQKRIFLPYNENFDLSIHEKKIWEGWLIFLTYIFLHLDDIQHEEIFKNSYEAIDQNKIKFFYSQQSSLPSNIVSLCDIEIYDEMTSGTLIIINSPKTPPLKEISYERVKSSVLQSIDNSELYVKKGQDITDPSYYKEMRCIHIDLFFERFSEGFDIAEFSKVKQIIKSGIKEVLEK